MSPLVGWALAAAALIVGALGWGLRGFALAVTLVAFWLLLQFSRLVRVMRSAGDSPVGHVASAVMLHARLHAGMTMAQVIALTKSLGVRVDEAREIYRWHDDGGASVHITFADGRCASWTLARTPEEP